MHDDTSVVVLAWVSRPLLRGLGLVSSWTLFGLEEGSTRRPGPGAASLLLPSTVLLPVEPITCIYVKKIAMCILFSTACDFKSLLFMS